MMYMIEWVMVKCLNIQGWFGSEAACDKRVRGVKMFRWPHGNVLAGKKSFWVRYDLSGVTSAMVIGKSECCVKVCDYACRMPLCRMYKYNNGRTEDPFPQQQWGDSHHNLSIKTYTPVCHSEVLRFRGQECWYQAKLQQDWVKVGVDVGYILT